MSEYHEKLMYMTYQIYQFCGRCSIIIRHDYYSIFYISELSVLDGYL